MADNKTELQIVLTAIDNASKELEKVKSSLGGLDDQAKKSSQGQESMAASVFKGVMAWDLLKKGVGEATNFIKDSIEASMQAQAEMAIVKQNVENAGLSYDAIKDKLDAYSKSMLQMGFDDEDTATSVSKLLLVTKNYNQALTMNQLAMDLARNKHISLAEATSQVILVSQGVTKQLKGYGIELDDTASAADNLASLQDKVKGSAEAFANTTQGKMQVVSVTWKNFEEQIGDIFGPALNVALSNFNSFLNAANSNSGSFAKSASRTLAMVVNPDSWKAGGLQIINEAINKPIESFGNAIVGLSDKIYGTKSKVNTPYEDLQKTIDSLDGKINEATNSALNLQSSVKLQVPDIKDPFKGIGKGAGDAKQQADDLKKALSGLGDEYKTLKQSGSNALSELAYDHENKMASIRDEITKTNQVMEDLAKSYSQTQTDDTKSVAEQIVATEQKVADLKQQLNDETDSKKKADLMKQLNQEQAALAGSADFEKSIDAAVVEARRRANETDLQRAIEDYQSKRSIATQEYTDKLMDLQNQMNAQVAAQQQEIGLYNDKVKKIKDIMDTADKDYATVMDSHYKKTADTVNAEIDLFKALAKAISDSQSAQSASILTTKTASIPISGKKAAGGPVGIGEAYLVGEQGPEIFVPGASGNIVPNNKVGGNSTSIVINVTGNHFMNERDFDNMIDKSVMKKLRQNTMVY
ncbi:MAG: hypothetical protein PHO56_02250 [Patescibacteria group bacterium]|nr:hypothetical protein [Patescibacteria group bacterium]